MDLLPNPQEAIKNLNLSKPLRFSKIVLIIGPVILLLAGVLIGRGVRGSNKASVSQNPTNQIKETTNQSPESTSAVDTDKPPLPLKNIGINIDYYDPKTNKAGDFLFTKQKLQFDRLFMGYGFVIPGNSTSSGKDKANPQPTFIVPLGTKVLSLVDGVVANVGKVWSGDYSIQVTQNGKMEKWAYETEHVINPVVKVGDRVKAGQVLAEVSTFDSGVPSGYGTVEIGILKGGNPPQHVCPFLYLDPGVKQDIEKKISALYKSWADYRGDLKLNNVSTHSSPGCLNTDPIDG